MSDSDEVDNKPSPEEQKRVIAKLIEAEPPMAGCATYFVIFGRWYEDWKVYTKPEHEEEGSEDAVEPPGPINNMELLADKNYKLRERKPTIRTGLQERKSHFVISEKVWTQLHSWYQFFSLTIQWQTY